MSRDIGRFAGGIYDVLIIGGGINGAAIAHMAALNGLKTILLEKNDFAGGTSSKSTKLIHGGLRYLENFEFDLVREALQERHIQLQNAPHLVKPLGFIVPVYKTDRRPLWMMRLGVFLYDFLSGKFLIEKHRTLSVMEVIEHIPGIRQEGLVGGVVYYDAQMDDARLCLENILSAKEKGADILNYTEVRTFIKSQGKVVGVTARDVLSDSSFEVHAQHIVCALGPWTNEFIEQDKSRLTRRVRATKGVHIVYEGEFADCALLIPTQSDGRIFFIIPWMGNSLIGTTDTDYTNSADKVTVEEEDIDYLFREVQRLFPQIKLVRDNIITTFAGLRPLVHEQGRPSQVSRKHVIEKSDTGLIYVMGGKYTTYRKIAEDTVRLLTPRELIDTRENFPLYGCGQLKETPARAAKEFGLSLELVQYLMNLYGIRYKEVLALVKKDECLKERLCSCSPAIKAQVVYAVEAELAERWEDIYYRRLSLVYRQCPTKACQRTIQEMVRRQS